MCWLLHKFVFHKGLLCYFLLFLRTFLPTWIDKMKLCSPFPRHLTNVLSAVKPTLLHLTGFLHFVILYFVRCRKYHFPLYKNKCLNFRRTDFIRHCPLLKFIKFTLMFNQSSRPLYLLVDNTILREKICSSFFPP